MGLEDLKKQAEEGLEVAKDKATEAAEAAEAAKDKATEVVTELKDKFQK